MAHGSHGRPPTARLAARLAALLLLACLADADPAWAQPAPAPADEGAGIVQEGAASYLGTSPRGRTLLLMFETATDGTARAVLLEAPPEHGQGPGLNLSFAGPYRAEEASVVLTAEGRRRTAASPTARMEARVPRSRGDSLDPFGIADVTLHGLPAHWAGSGAEDPVRLRLEGIATALRSEVALADGTVRVSRRAPFFYAEPWRGLDLVSFARLEVDRSVAEGLAQRRERPRAASGAWWDERVVEVQSLSRKLVSVRVESHVYRGGAHPNTHLTARTFLRAADGAWRLASPCEALGVLGRPCDRPRVRERVIRDLERQEAAWVVDGEVNESTPWLLDRTTLTPTGLRVDFEPYAVGPYAQGVFTVHVPFPIDGTPPADGDDAGSP